MTLPAFIRTYTLSPTGLTVLGLSVFAGAVVASTVSPLGALAVIPAVWILFSLLLFSVGIGTTAVVNERSRLRRGIERDLLHTASSRTKRIGRLRLPDPEMKKLTEHISYTAGEYCRTARASQTYDPKAHHAIEECLEIIDAWLAGRNRISARHHYGDQQLDPEYMANLDARTRSLLTDRVSIIERATLQISGGLTPDDILTIKEELEQ